MKNLTLALMGLLLLGTVTSCKKRGCTIDYAKNFDATAKKSDQSCEFFYTAQITSIKLTKFPDLDANGENWDIGDFPDLYIRITNHEDEIKYQTPKISNVPLNDTVQWSVPNFVKIDTSSSIAQIKLYEVDDLAAELMEKFPININNYLHESTSGDQKYPEVIALLTDSVNMKIYLNWVE